MHIYNDDNKTLIAEDIGAGAFKKFCTGNISSMFDGVTSETIDFYPELIWIKCLKQKINKK